MKSFVIAGVAAGLAMGSISAFAGEAKKADLPKGDQPAKEMPALTDMTLTGKIVKEEMTKKDNQGNEVKATKFMLKTADGMVALPTSKDVDLAAMADKDVTVEGQGYEKDGKKMLKKITKVTEAAPAAH